MRGILSPGDDRDVNQGQCRSEKGNKYAIPSSRKDLRFAVVPSVQIRGVANRCGVKNMHVTKLNWFMVSNNGTKSSLYSLILYQNSNPFSISHRRKTVFVKSLRRGTGNQKKMAKDTMKAVVFKEPYEVALEDRPVPKIKDSTDIIVKVIYSALCGRCS